VKKIDYICDKCKIGIMESIHQRNLMSPPTHVHVCSNCENEQNLSESYPLIRFSSPVDGIIVDISYKPKKYVFKKVTLKIPIEENKQ